eukprot:s3677_g7.t1
MHPRRSHPAWCRTPRQTVANMASSERRSMKGMANTKTLIGPYSVGGTIGKGGFGCVYKAMDQQRALFVAIKQVSLGGLHSGDISQIEVEINLLSKLKHKNIVKYMDSIRTETHLNIVLEFVEGGSIAAIIKKFGAFPESLCAIYTLQILKGLKFLHSQGVIHRDIKGANVLTTKTGTIKLADFGVATKLSEIDSSKRRVVGTPYWMAPETVEMSPPTPASDIWSVGSTVVEMITEKPPYADLPQMSALYRIVSDNHPPLPEGFSEALDAFLLRCYEKNPLHRAGAATLLEDHWIQANKKHTLEFTRQMLTPKVTQKESPQRRVEDEEEDSGESGAEEMEAFTTLIRDTLVTQQRPGMEALGLPSLHDSHELEVRSLDKASSEKSSSRSSKQGTVKYPIEEGADAGTNLDEYPSRKLLESLPEGSIPEASKGEAQEVNSEELRGYHFAFLDYYKEYCEAKPSAEAGSGPKQSDSLRRRPNRPPSGQLRAKDVIQDDSKENRERQRAAAEIKSLLSSIRPFEESGVLVRVCKRLTELLQQGMQQGSSSKDSIQQLIIEHGVVPIVEMLQVTDPMLLRQVLKVVNQIVAEWNHDFQELFSMVGLIPGVIKFAGSEFARDLRVEAGTFISRLCNSGSSSLQMLIACGGLEAIVDLISYDYYQNRDLVWNALDAVNTVKNKKSSHSRDLCRILAKRGLCGHLVLLIDNLATDIQEKAAHCLQEVIRILGFFAKTGDSVVKAYMAKAPVLEGLIASLEYLPPPLAAEVCRIFKHLSQEPSVLNMMENVGLVPVLVYHMKLHSIFEKGTWDGTEKDLENEKAQDACSQCLLALSNLCKLSRPRQEQAALAGAIPKLQALVERGHPLQEYAFVMICDMACASLATRKSLWTEDGGPFLVRSLAVPETQVPALEALVGWFGVKEHKANWCERLEGKLLKGPDFLMRLFALFRSEDKDVFLKILDPLVKLVRISSETNAALANSDQFLAELLRRLEGEGSDSPDASRVASSARFNSDDFFGNPGLGRAALEESSLNGVRRLVSAQPGALADNSVRARQTLLRLLLQLCQPLSKPQLAALVQRFRLKSHLQRVLAEERRKQRVILSAIASQLLAMFMEAAPGDLDINPNVV